MIGSCRIECVARFKSEIPLGMNRATHMKSVIAQPLDLALRFFFGVLDTVVDPVEHRTDLPAPLRREQDRGRKLVAVDHTLNRAWDYPEDLCQRRFIHNGIAR